MKLSLRLFISIVICCHIISCEELFKPEAIINDGLENITFECYNVTSDYYFKGIFGKDSICANDGVNGYAIYFGIGNGFVTLTPTITIESLQSQKSKSFVDFGIQRISDSGDFLEEIRVTAQPSKFGTPLDSMVRAFIVSGVHPVRSLINKDSISTKGFEIILSKRYWNPNLNPDTWMIICTSALGFQPPESNVTILDVSLIENGDYIEGYIHLHFNCRMYLQNAGKLTGTFARDMSGDFNLPIRYKL